MEQSLDASRARRIMNKVPEVTLYFWIIKILATTVGETAADFLAVNLNLGITVTSYLMTGLLVAALVVQFRAHRYIPWAYWLSVVLISVVGTLLTDNLVDHLGVSLQTTTVTFAVALVLTFIAWFAVEKTLSIHSIYTLRRELFYWLAILFTFALGTAAGDLVSEAAGLGYGLAGMVFGSGILTIIFAYYILEMNAVLAFWLAYILTRPLGASLGDLLSKPAAEGGVGFGTVGTSALFVAVILGLVAYLTVTKKDQTLVPQETVIARITD